MTANTDEASSQQEHSKLVDAMKNLADVQRELAEGQRLLLTGHNDCALLLWRSCLTTKAYFPYLLLLKQGACCRCKFCMYL